MGAGRPLTDNERAILERLLAGDFDGADAFRAQLPAAKVVDVCGCGCGSIQLAVDRTLAEPAPDQEPGYDMIVENGGKTSWLMLHQKNGWLRELEHVPGHGPPPSQVDPADVFPEA